MTTTFGGAVPILRVFDEATAKAFYVEHLGFTVDWEHRFEPSFPLYLQVHRGDLVLHLSEHHGDGTPGTVVYVATTGLEALHAELADRPHPGSKPGLRTDELGTWLDLLDPFGNTLRLHERAPA
jgi:catechol 2,3-dioxygenase-like lactoylglutathione lyase family enzyme